MSNLTYYDIDAVCWLYWFLYGAIGNHYGVAGLMGNLFVESHCCPYELETHESQFDYCWNYTQDNIRTLSNAHDFGVQSYGGYYRNGVWYTAKGFGLAQWTWWQRKEELYNWNYNGKDHTYLGDMERDAQFLVYEMYRDYRSVWDTLVNATSIREASNKVLFDYEAPSDVGQAQQDARARYGQLIYDDFINRTPPVTPPQPVYPPEPTPPYVPTNPIPIFDMFVMTNRSDKYTNVKSDEMRTIEEGAYNVF